jgi:hypothetical protein
MKGQTPSHVEMKNLQMTTEAEWQPMLSSQQPGVRKTSTRENCIQE